MQNAHMRVQKVQKVQRVQRVVVAASPQILKRGGDGWRRGLGRRFARFALRAMSIKNYPHRFAKLVPWESAYAIPGESDSRKLIGLSLFSPFFQPLIQRFPAAAQGLEERYHVGEFLSFGQGIVLVQGQVMALCVQDSHVVGKAVGELVL